MVMACSILLPALLGYLTVSVLPGCGCSISRPERLTYAYPLGIGLVTLQMFFAGWAGFPLSRTFITVVISVEVAALLAWLFSRRSARACGAGTDTGSAEKRRRPLYERGVEALLWVWLVVKMGTIFYETSLRPVFSFDTITNWSVRAKLFYYSESLLLDPASYDFFGRGVLHAYGNYPPLNPLAQMWMAMWAGGFNEVLVKFWTPFFMLSAVAFLYLLISRELGRLPALVLVVIFASSPFVSFHATESMSDLPLAVYILFAYAALWRVIRGRLACLPLVGLFSVLAMFLKGEGLFVAIPLFLACLYALWSGRHLNGVSVKPLLLTFVAPYLLILPWFVFRSIYHLGHGADELYPTLVFRPMIVVEFLSLMLGLQNFNVVFIFVPVVLSACGRPDRETALMVLPLLAYSLFFLSLYVVVAYYSDFDRVAAAVFRNILTYYPSACLLLAVLLKKMSHGCGLLSVETAPEASAE